MLPPYLRVNFKKAEEVIVEFIEKKVKSAGAEGVVVGLSGGGDSAVATALAVKALGSENVLAFHLPDRESDRISALIASKVADSLDIELRIIDITPIVTSFLNSLGWSYQASDKIVRGNIKVRTRMSILYAMANSMNRLVLGTSDRSEWLIGYFTKWGDGAADLYPIIGLYKTQVREFGKLLSLPPEVMSRPPTPDLWKGHTAEGEIGVTYDVIDEVLYWLFDEGLSVDELMDKHLVPREVIEHIIELHRKTEHKRKPLVAPFWSFKELMK